MVERETFVPRRLRFPDLPQGPHQELLLFLRGLHQLAGEPSTRDIADGIFKASNGEVRCSHTTIHALLAGRKLPTNGDLLFELVKFLNNRNRHRRADEDALLDELDKLWRPATRRHLLDLPTPLSLASETTQLTPDRPVANHSSPPAGGIWAGEASQTGSSRLNSPAPETNTPRANDVSARTVILPREPVAVSDRSALVDQVEGRDPALPELRTSQAVLVGVGRYHDETLPNIAGVPAGVARLRELLQQPPGTFLGENVVMVNDPGRHELLKSVQQAADKAEDTLLVYFAGHGLVSPKGDLLLATSDTEFHAEYSTAPYDAIRDLISGSRARRNVVLLDCCFSGRALEALGPLGALADIPSAYVITSTSRNTAAFAPAGSRYTQFTGALIETLEEGIPGGRELLTVSDIFNQIRRKALEQGFPAPEWRAHNDQGLALARNPAYTQRLEPPPREPRELDGVTATHKDSRA
jgi:hypothetical protein